MKKLWLPRAMRKAPRLDPLLRTTPPEANVALLINPFYPKDPHASFGKHVLTPSLALTSIAGSHAAGLGGRVLGREPACKARRRASRFPQVVGITVHLTFAERAYALARWYRHRGAKVVLGGLHVLPVPKKLRRTPTPWRSARACSFGRQILRDVEAGTLQAGLSRQTIAGPIATIRRRGAICCRERFLDHDQPDRHARLPQPLRLLLPVHRGLHMPYLHARRRADRRRVPGRRSALRRVHRQQSRLAARVPAELCAGPCGRWKRSGAPPCRST